ncbi:MAG: hypothetical protein Q8O89_03640 [Nanoarchaeota archaeon]|nr:hypothetical protein [Nanoarchaeota archaeon]
MVETQSKTYGTRNFPIIIPKSDERKYIEFNGSKILEYIINKELSHFFRYSSNDDFVMQSFLGSVNNLLFNAETRPEIIKQRQELFNFALTDSQFTNALCKCHISNTDLNRYGKWTSKNSEISTRYRNFEECVERLIRELDNKKLPPCLDKLLASLKENSEDLAEVKKLIEQPFKLEIKFSGQYEKSQAKDETKNEVKDRLDVILLNYSYKVINTANNREDKGGSKDPTKDHRYVWEADTIGFDRKARSEKNYLGYVLHSLIHDAVWLEEKYKVIQDKGSFRGHIKYTPRAKVNGQITFEFEKKGNVSARISTDFDSPDLKKPDILFLNSQYCDENRICSKDSFRMIESHHHWNLFHKFILDYWNDYRYNLMGQFEKTINKFESLLWELRIILPLTNMMEKIQENFKLTTPAIISSGDTTTNTDIYIKNMQNPILAYFSSAPHKDFKVPEQLIPNDVDITTGKNIVILTGPNGNGKTTFLESILANYCLFQAGLPVVADEAKIRVKVGGRALYGENGDISEGESKHMADCRNYSEFLEGVMSHMLTTSDESFSATSIEDATNIQRGILENFIINANVTFLMVVHNTLLAEEMSKNPYITTLCCRLDHSENPPKKTYKIVSGIDKSYGYLEAEKWGLDTKSLQTRFEKKVNEGTITPRESD